MILNWSKSELQTNKFYNNISETFGCCNKHLFYSMFLKTDSLILLPLVSVPLNEFIKSKILYEHIKSLHTAKEIIYLDKPETYPEILTIYREQLLSNIFLNRWCAVSPIGLLTSAVKHKIEFPIQPESTLTDVLAINNTINSSNKKIPHFILIHKRQVLSPSKSCWYFNKMIQEMKNGMSIRSCVKKFNIYIIIIL